MAGPKAMCERQPTRQKRAQCKSIAEYESQYYSERY